MHGSVQGLSWHQNQNQKSTLYICISIRTSICQSIHQDLHPSLHLYTLSFNTYTVATSVAESTQAVRKKKLFISTPAKTFHILPTLHPSVPPLPPSFPPSFPHPLPHHHPSSLPPPSSHFSEMSKTSVRTVRKTKITLHDFIFGDSLTNYNTSFGASKIITLVFFFFTTRFDVRTLSRTGTERGAEDLITLVSQRKLHLSARSELITDIHQITLHFCPDKYKLRITSLHFFNSLRIIYVIFIFRTVSRRSKTRSV